VIITSDELLRIPAPERIQLRNSKLNAALGGGLVPGAVVLLTGAAGVGKSTLLLGNAPPGSLYNNNEEATGAFAYKARSSGMLPHDVSFLFTKDLHQVFTSALNMKCSCLIVDSLQETNLMRPELVAEACATFAHKTNIPVFVIGHINKRGQRSGPERVAHLIDVHIHMSSRDVFEVKKNRYPSLQVTSEEPPEALEVDDFVPVEFPPIKLSDVTKDHNVLRKAMSGATALFTLYSILLAPIAFGGSDKK
jgi:predicted ATP-dependent serine protease